MSNKSEMHTIELLCPGMDPMRVSEVTFAQLPPECHVSDINSVIQGMPGKGIKIAGLLELATIPREADHITFISQDGQYSASLTIDQAKKYGILVYQVEGKPLPSAKGGPFRLITPGLGDLCANVKNIGLIKITTGPGKDTRPEERSC